MLCEGNEVMDSNTFFREATLRICSSLDAEVFLLKSFQYLKSAIDLPADYANIVYLSEDYSRLQMLALTSDEEGMRYSDSVDIPRETLNLYSEQDSLPDVMISNSLNEHPFARLWIDKGYDKNISQLSLRIYIGNQRIGAVNFISHKDNRFTQKQAQWIHLLKEPFSIAVSNAIYQQKILTLEEQLKENSHYFREELRMVKGNEIIGSDQGLKQVMSMVDRVAAHSSPVLLLGETGAGKEVIAGAIHQMSGRSHGPFVKVNCGAIPDNLVDSELFGHEKGAFTGAFSTRKGRFELADKGTLFLDEVGELPLDVQIRLLRAIQEKEIERVGGAGAVPVDIRIIAATHRQLPDLIRRGKFREDLFFRLNVFPIAIPPLRDRKSDILGLAQYFIRKKTMEMGMDKMPYLSAPAHGKLLSYSWPGNVRELENVIERAIILGRGEWLDFDWLSLPEASLPQPLDPLPHAKYFFTPGEEKLNLEAAMRDHIRKVVNLANGKISGKNGAAQMLGINPSTLRNRMKKLGMG